MCEYGLTGFGRLSCVVWLWTLMLTYLITVTSTLDHPPYIGPELLLSVGNVSVSCQCSLTLGTWPWTSAGLLWVGFGLLALTAVTDVTAAACLTRNKHMKPMRVVTQVMALLLYTFVFVCLLQLVLVCASQVRVINYSARLLCHNEYNHAVSLCPDCVDTKIIQMISACQMKTQFHNTINSYFIAPVLAVFSLLLANLNWDFYKIVEEDAKTEKHPVYWVA